MIKNLLKLLTQTVFWIIKFLLTWCMYIQNNIITSTAQNYIWHPVT